MFPQHLLPKLSPNAAKLFLVLLSYIEPKSRIPFARASIQEIVALAALSPRACSRALAQLKALRLIQSRPHRYHSPAAYLFLPPESVYNSTSTSRPPQASMPPNRRANPRAPLTTPPPSTLIAASKMQSPPPQAGILKQCAEPHTSASPVLHHPRLRAVGGAT